MRTPEGEELDIVAGEEQTTTPRHPEYLDRVSVGDLVTLTYTEIIALDVVE